MFPDEYITRTLAGEYAHRKMFVTVDQNTIRVSVKACHDAIIGLATDTGDEKFVHTEVILGAEDNVGVWIRGRISGVIHEQVAGNYMDCNTYKDFWVQWAENGLSVGIGHDVPNRRILQWSEFNTTANPARAVSFTPGASANMSVKVFLDEGEQHE